MEDISDDEFYEFINQRFKKRMNATAAFLFLSFSITILHIILVSISPLFVLLLA